MALFSNEPCRHFEACGLSLSRHSPYVSGLSDVRSRARSRRPSVIPSTHGSLLTRKKKEVSDFLVIGYLYLSLNLNFIYVTSFTCIQLTFVLK